MFGGEMAKWCVFYLKKKRRENLGISLKRQLQIFAPKICFKLSQGDCIGLQIYGNLSRVQQVPKPGDLSDVITRKLINARCLQWQYAKFFTKRSS